MHHYFCGWYVKCQSDTQTMAIIPAIHEGNRSIQLITDEGAWNVSHLCGNYFFSRNGMKIQLHTDDLDLAGEVTFSHLTPVKYDIMGPFRYVPFMECRHSVISMRHRVDGEMHINGVHYQFDNALGYIEGDRGYSFPAEYAWTHCFFEGGSLMLSAGNIPFCGGHFTGVIGVILWQDREYRIATYFGARVVKMADGAMVITQGSYQFTAKLIEKRSHPLYAPVNGHMIRTIHESACCHAMYSFSKNGQILFAFETDRASFEFEYGGEI